MFPLLMIRFFVGVMAVQMCVSINARVYAGGCEIPQPSFVSLKPLLDFAEVI